MLRGADCVTLVQELLASAPVEEPESRRKRVRSDTPGPADSEEDIAPSEDFDVASHSELEGPGSGDSESDDSGMFKCRGVCLSCPQAIWKVKLLSDPHHPCHGVMVPMLMMSRLKHRCLH